MLWDSSAWLRALPGLDRGQGSRNGELRLAAAVEDPHHQAALPVGIQPDKTRCGRHEGSGSGNAGTGEAVKAMGRLRGTGTLRAPRQMPGEPGGMPPTSPRI